MRIYTAKHLEMLHALKLITYWEGEGLLTQQQSQQLQAETVSDLRTTNVFLRAVLFFFTVVILVGATALFVVVFAGARSTDFIIPSLLLSVACYAAAEWAVNQGRLYHFGIEEALVLCSIGTLFASLQLGRDHFGAGSDHVEVVILAVCAAFALWTWQRFGYWYSFVVAMVFTAVTPHYITRSPAAQHALLAALYAAGIAGIIAVGSRHRVDHMQRFYSVAEAFLWAGIYLSINLVLSVLHPDWLTGLIPAASAFPKPFYWFTWLLTWCLPPSILARGIHRKDRILLALGAGLCVLTLISNKPYLGWQRHTWDPMLLGVFLTGGAWYLQRWLACGPGGVRNGFTAARLVGKQSTWINTAPAALSLLGPHAMAHSPQPGNADQPLGQGGSSGGAGAGGDF